MEIKVGENIKNAHFIHCQASKLCMVHGYMVGNKK